MTINKLWHKLRIYHKQDYRQFQFCLLMAVMLITSFLLMLFSPIVQKTLPEGGDSRKQIYMVLVVAVVGCFIFVLYAAGLFYRLISRQMGVFLALGANKSEMIRSISIEIARMLVKCSVAGMLAGAVLSFAFGKIFEAIAGGANAHHFKVTMSGMTASLLYIAVLFVMVLVFIRRRVKKSTLLEIMNSQKQSEPLKKMVGAGYLYSGIALTFIGIITGLIIPTIVARAFKHFLGSWTNLFYLLVFIGLYRIIVYSIACHKRGKHPQKYYDHLISFGIMKFQGRSVVRNMFVIALLIMASLLCIFYNPLLFFMNSIEGSKNEAGYAYYYPNNADEIKENEVLRLADEHNVQIKHYREGEMTTALGDGVDRENVDKDGNLIEKYCDPYAEYECISADTYQKLTGQQINVAQGTYYQVTYADAKENLYRRYGEMKKLYLADNEQSIQLTYKGHKRYNSLVYLDGFGDASRFVLNDKDYEVLRENRALQKVQTQVLFDADETKSAIKFSEALYKDFTDRMSKNMNVGAYYDAYQAKTEGTSYGYSGTAIVDADIPQMETDWKYVPVFSYMTQQYDLLTHAVFVLLFLYVAIICLTAVGVIAYTRSQAIGLSNYNVFNDLFKLGANQEYRLDLLKEQVKKVFVLPTIIGCSGAVIFEIITMWTNDGHIERMEMLMIIPILLIVAVTAFYMGITYHYSLKRTERILSLS